MVRQGYKGPPPETHSHRRGIAAGLFWGDTIDGDCPSRGMLQIGHAAQKRGLATSRRADETDEVALLDIEINVFQCMHRAIICLKGQREVLCLLITVDDSLSCLSGQSLLTSLVTPQRRKVGGAE